jgi:hypothetical protein
MQGIRYSLAISLTLLVSGCGMNSIGESGKPATESRNVNGFNTVTLEGSGQLIVEQTGTESLTITADDNFLPYLTSDVSGGHLTLGTKGASGLSSSTPVLYKLSVNNLTEITLSGSGSVNGKGFRADSLKIAIGGSGDITADGAVERLELLLAGSGSYRGDGLQGKDVNVQILGSGSAVLAASQKLDVIIAGSGSVEYLGNPVVTTKSLGSGSVTKR